jgi:hypothetical protein
MSDANAPNRKRASMKCGSEQANGGDSVAELVARSLRYSIGRTWSQSPAGRVYPYGTRLRLRGAHYRHVTIREDLMPSTAQQHAITTTRSDTRAVTIDAAASVVFDFVAEPENLPRWAVGFCRSIRRDEEVPGCWIVTTGQGDLPVRYVADRKLGVIDFYLSPAPGVEAAAFSRVVPNGDGAEYVFTQFQAPGMPDNVFEAQVRALAEELHVLRGLIRARAACPV